MLREGLLEPIQLPAEGGCLAVGTYSDYPHGQAYAE